MFFYIYTCMRRYMCSALKWSSWIIHERLRVMPFIIFIHVCLRHLFKPFMIVFRTTPTIKYSSINFIVPLYCYCSSNNLVTTSFMSNVTLLMFVTSIIVVHGYIYRILQWILFPFRLCVIIFSLLLLYKLDCCSCTANNKCTRYMNTSGMLTSWHHNSIPNTLI